MAPRIYTSPKPSERIVETSVFTHLMASSPHDPHSVGGFPGSSPAFVDAETGTTLTRAQTKALTLQLAYGLRHHPKFQARRGDVALIFSQNSLAWPVVLFGSGEPRAYMCPQQTQI